ncbi:MAG: cyclic nucleotide-binding domain-containing protein [Xanthobacteraceae bacterium]
MFEITGYVASALVLATFWMRTMIPLRLVALGSNIAFIVYGILGGLVPIWVLHSILLPLNIYRTVEMARLLQRVRRAARGDLSLDWLKPYMKTERHRTEHVLFRKGDMADRLYLILRGVVRLAESDTRLGAGQIFGEIGLFSPDRQRTQTAICDSAVELLWIGERELAQLCYQNPGMAFHLLHLVTARLLSNVTRLEAVLPDERQPSAP